MIVDSLIASNVVVESYNLIQKSVLSMNVHTKPDVKLSEFSRAYVSSEDNK